MADTKKMNIIMILSDDQGSWSLGSYGNPEIHTPVLDRMAEEGLRFENFFCTSPVCSPARASIPGKCPLSTVSWTGWAAAPLTKMTTVDLRLIIAMRFHIWQTLRPAKAGRRMEKWALRKHCPTRST